MPNLDPNLQSDFDMQITLKEMQARRAKMLAKVYEVFSDCCSDCNPLEDLPSRLIVLGVLNVTMEDIFVTGKEDFNAKSKS